ncbi:B-cell antigen receptor complex-associated protein alpha chain [Xiphias gladius]|uniref:B-cell antigen receptor complex-associated protein alpha chain n=1 Tax=Xiphias gladius TaxID=8245 RepID=UPI001A9972F8|nr:B-cell antigen receptor complex-associated protein alpha chain [Xiphias gladius]
MGIATIYVLCSFVVGIAQSELTLKTDKPFLSVPLSHKAELECCYTTSSDSVSFSWVKIFQDVNKTFGTAAVNLSDQVTASKSDAQCGILTFSSVQLNDSGLYCCKLNDSEIELISHGTYLQVYKPLDKTLNLSESTKNKILTAEGILLLLCVILPSATLLCKSKKIHELEKKKMKMEEENIYQGLNLDDCCTTYDQIERSQVHGPYQDVCNIMEEEEEIQLEKP